MAIVIGLDIGTTNWKVAAFTPEGQLRSIRKTPTPTHYHETGYGYYEPEELKSCFATLLRQVLADCPGEEVLGVSVTSMTESVVPLSAEGEALFPIVAWFDASAAREAKQIRERFGTEKIFAVCGVDPDPIFSLPKMLWIRKSHPEVFDRAVKWLQMADYMYFLLCGAYVTDYSMAGRTLMYDISRCEWSRELTEPFGVSCSVMPDVLSSGSLAGRVHKKASADTGLPVGTPVYVGGHDHLCATIPSGCLAGRKMMDSSGTVECYLMISDKGMPVPTRFAGARVGRYLQPERYVLWGSIKSSGASADWAYDLLTTRNGWTGEKEKIDYAAVLSRCGEVPFGSEGAIYVPHLRGSGAPFWNPSDRGAFVGLTSRHTAPHLTRAVFEGLCCQSRMIVEMHESISGTRPEALCVAGGSTKNRFWQQLKADILQLPVELSNVEDATVQGAALLAAIGAGVYGSIEEASAAMARENEILLPDPARKDAADALYRKYCVANDAVNNLHRTIASIDNK